MGGSMIVHAFGCYFGLAVARCLYKPGAMMDNGAESEFIILFSAVLTLLFERRRIPLRFVLHDWNGFPVDVLAFIQLCPRRFRQRASVSFCEFDLNFTNLIQLRGYHQYLPRSILCLRRYLYRIYLDQPKEEDHDGTHSKRHPSR